MTVADDVGCQGCGTTTNRSFQCPLCQAEGVTDRGYFCTQECFAAHWLAHRDEVHNKGRVRAKAPAPAKAAVPPEDSVIGKKEAKKRAREAQLQEKQSSKPKRFFMPWPVLPTAAVCKAQRWAQVSPSLAVDTPRAVVAVEGTSTNLWTAFVAAAHYVAEALQARPALQVLVAAGCPSAAHGFAWAARCAGLSGQLRMAIVALEEDTQPHTLFSAQRRVMVATAEVLRDVPEPSGAASLWLTTPDSLLVTLPDVPQPEDLQGVGTRAIFFVQPDRSSDAPEAKKTKAEAPKATKGSKKNKKQQQKEEEEKGEGALTVTHRVSSLGLKNEFGQPLSWDPILPALAADGAAALATFAESTSEKEGAAGDAEQSSERTEEQDMAAALTALHKKFRKQCQYDNDVSTLLANGDFAAALQALVRVYSTSPAYCEQIIFHSLCCALDSVSVAHAHHRMAYAARYLCDHSARFLSSKNNKNKNVHHSLSDMALRAVAMVCKLLPPLRLSEKDRQLVGEVDSEAAQTEKGNSAKDGKELAEDEKPSLATTTVPRAFVDGAKPPSALELERYCNYYSPLPNLQLQATLCYLFPTATPAVMDTLAYAWGAYRYVAGPAALAAADGARLKVVQRLQSRFSAKMDPKAAAYFVILTHFLYDLVGTYALPLAEVDRRTLWSLTIAADAGTLESFLAMVGLYHPDGVANGKKGAAAGASKDEAPTSLSSRQQPGGANNDRETTAQRVAKLKCFPVYSAGPFRALKYATFPISGERQRTVARLHKAAVEEVLMAMPKQPRPMYIGDVGNLIGKWFSFNARYDGTLGVTLQDFLQKHPESFALAGRLVTRRTAGKTEQVKLRFRDDLHDDDDSDDEDGQSRKARDRRMLTGAKRREEKEKDLPSRARKKRAVKEFNKSRFNRNYKQIDPSARVPGYVKHGARRIKGRGKKANKRLTKRN